MKKIISIIGIIALTTITILNFIFTAKIDASEHVTINLNNPIYIIGLILLGAIIFIITNKINKKYKNQLKKENKNKYISYICNIKHNMDNNNHTTNYRRPRTCL